MARKDSPDYARQCLYRTKKAPLRNEETPCIIQLAIWLYARKERTIFEIVPPSA